MEKKYTKLFIASLSMLFVFSAATAQLDLPSNSQMAKVEQRVGISDIMITYSRPSVNNREIWGQLVPYGMNDFGFGTAKESPWRAGADKNTTINFSDDVKVEGKPLAAGTYGLHMVINEDDSATVIFSNNSSAWGSYFYEPSEDALRVDVDTKAIPHTEQLTFVFKDVDATSATAALEWEKKQIPFDIEIDVTEVVLADIRQKLQDAPGFNRQSWEQAANFSLNNGGDLDEALGWANAAIEGQFFSQKNFNNLNIKAQILEKQGKPQEAEAVMDEALEMATVFQTHAYGRQLIAQGKKEKALEIFKLNAKKNKNVWPVDYGLARGYSANGEYKTALKHLKLAQNRVPDEQNRQVIAANIVKLENGEGIN